jgi:hypothetical protein
MTLYAEGCYAEGCYAEGCYAEGCYAEYHYAEPNKIQHKNWKMRLAAIWHSMLSDIMLILTKLSIKI